MIQATSLARRELGLMLSQLPLETLLGARLDRGARRGDPL